MLGSWWNGIRQHTSAGASWRPASWVTASTTAARCTGTATPVYTVRGFAPGGRVWKLSLVVTLNPGENRAPTKPVQSKYFVSGRACHPCRHSRCHMLCDILASSTSLCWLLLVLWMWHAPTRGSTSEKHPVRQTRGVRTADDANGNAVVDALRGAGLYRAHGAVRVSHVYPLFRAAASCSAHAGMVGISCRWTLGKGNG